MTALRVLAILIALGGIVDPAIRLSRRLPPTVRVVAAADDPDAAAAVTALRSGLSGQASLVEAGRGLATVVVGRTAVPPAAAGEAPISVVSLEEPPSVAIVHTPDQVRLIPGSAIDVPITLEGLGLTGQRSAIVLEQEGVELARAEHTWTGDGRITIPLSYVAPSAGVRRLTARVEPHPGERRLSDNHADLLAMAGSRPGRVAVLEPRPSWTAGFLRRALEADPAFEVSSVIRTSRGISSRAGSAPPVLQPQQLARFDVVVVGAPEELQRDDVETLWAFAGVRGGTLVLLPDRVPTGAYAARLPGKVSERLLNEPGPLEPSGILASELAVIPDVPRSGRVLAGSSGAPVILSWSEGEGRIVFSGALDAWRYRGDPKSRLAQFWRDELLSSALDAPPPVQLEVRPAVLRPGAAAHLRVRLRRTEWIQGREGRQAGVRLPPVEAHVTDPSGAVESIRLWPDADLGVFVGDVAVAAAGVHTVRVSTDGETAETVMLADRDAAQAVPAAVDLDAIAAITGGVAVPATRMTPLVQHLSSLQGPVAAVPVRVFESAAWPWIFAAVLCGEWMLRRRAGLR